MNAATAEVLGRARTLKLMMFDVDGVLTDGSLYLSDTGEEIKAFHTLDGLGLKLLQRTGLESAEEQREEQAEMRFHGDAEVQEGGGTTGGRGRGRERGRVVSAYSRG